MKKTLTVAMPTPHALTPLEATDVRVWMVSVEMVFNVKVNYSLEPGPTLVDMVTTGFGPGRQYK